MLQKILFLPQIVLLCVLGAATFFCACSDDASNTVASASPDALTSSSSNVIASSAGAKQSLMKCSGVVVDTAGAAVAGARVVAYYDDSKQITLGDSVVAETDEQGDFELLLDSAKSFVLFASKGEDAGFANSGKKQIVIGKRKLMFSGHIEEHNTGYVRIEGLAENFDLDADGYFVFYNVPPGDINLVYVDGGVPQAFLPIEILNDRDYVVLPALRIDENGSGRLNILNEDCYTSEGCYGARAVGSRL